MANPKPTLEENAAAPASVRGDAGEVSQHSLKDQIEFDKYRKSEKAVVKGKGYRLSKLIPPSAL